MSKYVPDDLKNMSKKELLEVALIMHEENVRFAKQLAKANKRIEELEYYNLRLANESHAKSLEIDKANKLAIEKKIEGAYAVISLLDETKDSKAILMANKYVREQLHKEQE